MLKKIIKIINFYGIEALKEILNEACLLNNWLLNIPENSHSSTFNTHWNIGEAYNARINGRFQEINRSELPHQYILERKGNFHSFDSWLQNVVWYGNKKGDYLNNFKIVMK